MSLMPTEPTINAPLEIGQSTIAALRAENDSLADLVHDLPLSLLDRKSYCRDWTVAQVLSHLGSSSEINVSNLRAALGVGERLPKEAYPQLWDRWDHLGTFDQLKGFLRWHGELVTRFEEFEHRGQSDLQVETAMGSMRVDALAGIRLREAAIHRWDIAVAYDESAVLRPQSVDILVDQLPEMTERLSDADVATSSDFTEISISISSPDRSFVLSLSEAVAINYATDSTLSAVIHLPGESFVRLLYGRWRDPHDKVNLEKPPGLLAELRTTFQGF